ncbi:hypothetical protein Acr_06g0007560 [Actinidia rufa]|uniref:Myb/SANT-like domain-containing protein n=1 Tax=Actinidia rufa TaxID=165716 RepID=A0A7J0ERI7_9ERIC|nr:hypothetical protein Acr_06g0007560 [Actinidia rufa]
MTKRIHDWKQMKNKYETLKKDWGSWMQLKDPCNGCTGLGYDQLQGIFTAPDHCKFLVVTATGRSQWTPGEDLPSTTLIDESNGSSDEVPTDEFGVGSGWKGRTPSEEAQRGQKRADRPSSDSTNATIGNCLHLLANLPGIDPLSPLYLLGTQLITIPVNCEVFMGLPNDDVRLAWLQMHRDQAAGTAPPFPGPYTRPLPPLYDYPGQP